MDSIPVISETATEDLEKNVQGGQDHLIKPIEKHVVHKICSGQVRKLCV